MPETCSACGCNNRCGDKPGLTFHRFPANPERREKWRAAVKREDWMPTKHSRVCREHSISGLTHAPRSDKMEMIFAVNDANTYMKYINSIKKFLEPYNDETQRDQQKFEDCGEQPGGYKNRGDLETEIGMRRACRFPKTLLGPCSGTEDEDFGFSEGKPCFIVKLNRIVYFKPEPPQSNESIPEEVQSKVQPNVIPLHCTSKKKEEEALLGAVAYYGIGEGFPLQYYPYYGKLLHSHYLQPLVAIQFINMTMNQEVRIECKVYGENMLQSEKDRYLGRFEVKMKVIRF